MSRTSQFHIDNEQHIIKTIDCIRLLFKKELLPDLHRHFQIETFHTSMYASNWFLTLFTNQFTLNTAYRIIDLFLSEVGNFIRPFTVYKRQKIRRKNTHTHTHIQEKTNWLNILSFHFFRHIYQGYGNDLSHWYCSTWDSSRRINAFIDGRHA
jgi:hypothetical protein